MTPVKPDRIKNFYSTKAIIIIMLYYAISGDRTKTLPGGQAGALPSDQTRARSVPGDRGQARARALPRARRSREVPSPPSLCWLVRTSARQSV